MIEKGVFLFWDEPESNINPMYIPIIVDLLLALSRNGVQIFVSTHDYFFSKYVETRKTEPDDVLYHSFQKENEQLTIETSKEFALLEKNGILEAARRLYREEIEKLENYQ